MRGCHFLHGEWDRIDEVLGLTQREDAGKLAIPNLVRPCNGLDHSQDGQKVARHSTAIHSLADTIGKRFDHIGGAQRPVYREGLAASLRPGSVVALPFAFKKPNLSEAHR